MLNQSYQKKASFELRLRPLFVSSFLKYMNWILNSSRRYKKFKKNVNIFQKMTNIKNSNVGSNQNRLHKKEQKGMKTINQLAIQSLILIKKDQRTARLRLFRIGSALLPGTEQNRTGNSSLPRLTSRSMSPIESYVYVCVRLANVFRQFSKPQKKKRVQQNFFVPPEVTRKRCRYRGEKKIKNLRMKL